MQKAIELLLSQTPKLLSLEQKYNNTYARFNHDIGKKEMLGYGGENGSMWSNDAHYFSKARIEGSVFDKELLFCESVCWMNPWTVIEHIPADWSQIDVVIYHVYKNNFRMNNKCNIKVVPMSRINEESPPWTAVWSTAWPLPGHQEQPRDQLVR